MKTGNGKKTIRKKLGQFEKLSAKITKVAGSPYAFTTAFLAVIVWGLCGPLFDYSNTWQLVINTTTTIVTFLMVFSIQQSQNRDTMALQLKLNELIAATKGASNRLIDIEDITGTELEAIKKFYIKLARLAEQEEDVLTSHSFDEATENHQEKMKSRKPGKPVSKDQK